MTLQNFRDTYLGKQVEFHSYGAGAFNQCVDLINAYINQVLDNQTKDYTEIIGTNAKDFNMKYDPEDFDWIANTPTGVPQEGDIIVWNGRVGGGAGHVAIFLSGDTNSFQSLDQNWSRKEYVTLENHNYSNVTGWLRPKYVQQMVTIPQIELDEIRLARDTHYNDLQAEKDSHAKTKSDLQKEQDRVGELLRQLEKYSEEDKDTLNKLLEAEKALQPYQEAINKIKSILRVNSDATLDDTVQAVITLSEQKTKYKGVPSRGLFLAINGTVLIGGDK